MSAKAILIGLVASALMACTANGSGDVASSTANDTDGDDVVDATLTFSAAGDWTPAWSGSDPNQAWVIKVVYDFDRLPQCRNTSRIDSWVIDMSYRIDGGATHTAALPGSPGAGETSDIINVTSGAKTLEVWFENHAVGGSDNCAAWDSQYGANYKFNFADDKGD